MAILVLSSWLKSQLWDLVSWRQRFIFHQMMSLDHVSAHNDPLSVTTSLLCGSLLSTSDLIMRLKFPSLAWREDPLWQILPSFDQESSILSYQLVASCNCWFFIAKAYQVIPCLIISWSLIVPPPLKPIPYFIHLNSLANCAPLAHRVARLHVTSLFGFTMWVISLVRSPLLILGILAYFWTQFPSPCMTALSLKRCRHEQALSWFPRKMCLTPCAGKLDHRFAFDWLTSCPDYNPALNCVSSPKRFSS
jgi:hypothetical protein